MAIEFFRQPTTEERGDFKPLLITDILAVSKFDEELAKKEREYALKKMPFCSRCAIRQYCPKIGVKRSR